MGKWADYGISSVRYDDQRSRIVKVKVHEIKGDTITVAAEWLRSQVVSALESGKTFVTILKGTDHGWKKGQDIHTVTVNGVKYIRTDQNHSASDNLENLPEF